MLEKGMKVKYGKVTGEVTEVVGEVVLVKLEDGKIYNLPASQITTTTAEAPLTYTKSQLKKMDFLEAMAKDMLEVGISELSIKNGKIDKFQAKESLEEKITKHQEAAKTESLKLMEEAEKNARKEFEDENEED